jgi:hypothetical protein
MTEQIRAAALSGDCNWKYEFFRKNFNVSKQHQVRRLRSTCDTTCRVSSLKLTLQRFAAKIYRSSCARDDEPSCPSSRTNRARAGYECQLYPDSTSSSPLTLACAPLFRRRTNASTRCSTRATAIGLHSARSRSLTLQPYQTLRLPAQSSPPIAGSPLTSFKPRAAIDKPATCSSSP